MSEAKELFEQITEMEREILDLRRFIEFSNSEIFEGERKVEFEFCQEGFIFSTDK